MTKGNVARLQGVVKRYGQTVALAGLDLSLHQGECLALVGHNGSGKSTMIKTLLGFVRPQDGTVEVLGAPASGRDSARARGLLGYLPENVAFDPGMTGLDVMRFYARLKNVDRSLCPALLERVGLLDAAARRIRGYSKGMRQRLGLAQAMLGETRLLLLDEPTTGLDPAGRRLFYSLIAGMKEEGRTILISSHALSELETQADRVAILSQGRLVGSGRLDEIRAEANLPVRLRVSTRECHGEKIMVRLPMCLDARVETSKSLMITCHMTDKLQVMRSLLNMGDMVTDIETVSPPLDALYAHLVNRDGT